MSPPPPLVPSTTRNSLLPSARIAREVEDLDNRGAETYCYRNSSHMNIERTRESTRTWGGGRSSLGYCFFFRRDSPKRLGEIHRTISL